MEIIYFLLPIALVLGGAFITAFIFASVYGQYDDLETPKHRILLEPDTITTTKKEENSRV